MARKARFATQQGAEAWAISKGAPQRGSNTRITSVTRGLIRFWLTASGMPSTQVVTLDLDQISAAWHDTTGATLARMIGRPAPTPEPITTPTTTEDETVSSQQPMILPRPAPRQDAPRTDASHEAKLRALAELLAPQPATMDEAQVVEIVTRHMGATMDAASHSVMEQARIELSDIVAEARGIVNGAPRTLRIEIGQHIRDMPPARRHPLFDTLLAMTVAARHGGLPVMIVGPAGSGKTTACEHVAAALGLSFFTNGALTGAHELTGYKDAAGQYHTTPMRQAFEFGGVYLMDEMDRSDPGAVLALNSALANGFMAFPDSAAPIRAHRDFVPMVAANTYGRGADRVYVGANQMDGATCDRFVMLDWTYDEGLERSIAQDDAWVSYVQAARAGAEKHKIRHVISPRASMAGAALRRAGLAFDLVTEAAIWKGLDKDQRGRIIADIPDSVTRRASSPVITLAAE